jgi:hypothetical protein
MPTTVVTTSWNDGHHKELRLAEHLDASVVPSHRPAVLVTCCEQNNRSPGRRN